MRRREQDDVSLVWDMLDAAQKIQPFVAGKSFHDYSRDEMLQSAVERKLEIIGNRRTLAYPFSPVPCHLRSAALPLAESFGAVLSRMAASATIFAALTVARDVQTVVKMHTARKAVSTRNRVRTTFASFLYRQGPWARLACSRLTVADAR
jgi:hypothetical protein